MKKLIVLTLFILCSFYILVDSKSQTPIETNIENKYFIIIQNRESINNIIRLDQEFFLKKFLERYNNNKNVEIIFRRALEYNVPIPLAFGLAVQESSLRSGAYQSNKDGSIDRGLFQLNTKSYPFLTKAQMYDPEINAKYGMAHIKELYDKNGSYEQSLMDYNCGNLNRINKGTVEHVLKILKEEEKINEMLVLAYEQFNWGEKFKDYSSNKIL